MATDDVIRQRQCRERKLQGIWTVRIKIPHEALTFALEQAGLLELHELEDRAAIARAIEDLLAEWTARVTGDIEV
jgi:hypothetical protein